VSVVMVQQPPVALYREDQWFSPWVYALVAVSTTLALFVIVLLWSRGDWPADPWLFARIDWPLLAVLGFSLPPALAFGFLKMTTEVSPTDLRVWFGLLPTIRHVVPIVAIRAVEVVRYRPLQDHGGWGLRRDRHGQRVFTARGDRGVRLTLQDGSQILIGSQKPEELADYIDRAVRNLM